MYTHTNTHTHTHTHTQAVSKYYSRRRALEGPYMSIEFEADSITLDIPFDGLPVGKWTLIPLTSPQVITLSNSLKKKSFLIYVTEYEKRDHVVTKITFCFNLLQE